MSKIISITPTGQWQDLFKLEVRFDNGDFGTAFAKSQTPPYAVGEDVEYTKNEKGTVKIQRANALVVVEAMPHRLHLPLKQMSVPLQSSAKLL
jgi:hypothetical protein